MLQCLLRKVGLCKDLNDEGKNVGSGLKSILDSVVHEITPTLSRPCVSEHETAELTNVGDVVRSPILLWELVGR